ncbi:hypothetical protein GIB67_038268 [Kingdonia uniflora]|uniref:Cyclin N-terminal domain-containing protein n=1 Tax=Kingdonia uniflora TaxID=39325 RepID=A0A7J7MSQ6_9MAGN|nr:hypothetical protein GIB67_038268 [Kingdonia uniflora]
MGRSNENNPCLIGGATNIQGGLRMEVEGNRRALSNISTNVVGVLPYPCAVTKRGLAEKNGMCEKKPVISLHRPITRRFAAQMANKQQQPVTKEIKKPVPPISKPIEEDCTIIDVEDYNEVINDDPVPMYVKHTEAMMDEIDQMEEVEMEDIVLESVDIDSCDAKNQLAVVEYVEDIYAYHRKTESSSCVPPNYMSQQFDINERMRAILIDWLIEVHYKFELMEETLFLTVNLIDRFLSCQTILRKKLQLVGVTAMLLACKYEEVSVPIVDDLIVISDKAYTRKEVIAMEKLLANSLQWNLSAPTPYAFMKRFLKAAESDKNLELLSFFLIELCLVEYEMLKYPPSLLAAAAVYTAQCSLNRFKNWSKACEVHTKYTEDELLECSRLMVTFHEKAGTGRLIGVHKKYSTFKFGCAAKSEPAQFLLEMSL